MNGALVRTTPAGRFSVVSCHDSTASCAFDGSWVAASDHLSIADVRGLLAPVLAGLSTVRFSFTQVNEWDGTLYAVLYALYRDLTARKIHVEYIECPPGLERLVRLGLAVPAQAREPETRAPFLERVGIATLERVEQTVTILTFIGENLRALFQFIRGRARVRRADLLEVLSDAGPSALPIVTLISVLVGVIFAFIGAIQLRQFGAQIYVANLVGIGMTREMGAVMVGIIMSGRTGAAFAAQLGTMQVNEEIDALKTLGISPLEFLVLPRTIALVIMMPLLCLYSDLGGIVGGIIVSVGALDVSLLQYLHQTADSITLTDISIGVVKSIVFGILIAWCGCYQGIQCGRSASSVGLATTSAVVAGIVSLVLVDAVFAVVCNILGI